MSKTDVLCGSHIPLLVKLMQKVDKPVLELGVGWNSTPLLHWMCKEKGLFLNSLEGDIDWLEKFTDFHEPGIHTVNYFDFENINWDSPAHFVELALQPHYGLVFIDHKPARKRRSSAKYFASRSDYIILHDSELADHPAYKYTPIYKHFKYKFEFKSVGEPHTIVLSNFKELSWLK